MIQEVYLDPSLTHAEIDGRKVVSTTEEAIALLKSKVGGLRFVQAASDQQIETVLDWLVKNISLIPTMVMFSIDPSRKPKVREWQNKIITAVNEHRKANGSLTIAKPIQAGTIPISELKEKMNFPVSKPKGDKFSLVVNTFWDVDQTEIQKEWYKWVNSGAEKKAQQIAVAPIKFVAMPQSSEIWAMGIVQSLHEPGDPPVAVPFLTDIELSNQRLKLAKKLEKDVERLLAATSEQLVELRVSDRDKEVNELRREIKHQIAEAESFMANATEDVTWVVGGVVE